MDALPINVMLLVMIDAVLVSNPSLPTIDPPIKYSGATVAPPPKAPPEKMAAAEVLS